ncbi:MAG: hypothetical protein WCJ35_28895 [Planctomycetota bacterium]
MAISCNSSTAAETPRRVGRFVAAQAFIWIVAAPILGAAVARGAVWAQSFWAPLVIFPMLVGCGLGLLLAGLMRLGQVGHRATLWTGTLLAVTVAVAGEHYFSFLDFKAAVIAQKPQGLSIVAFQAFQEMRMPDATTDFARFMQRQADQGRPVTAEFTLRGAAAWASWALDGLLMLLATLMIVCLACKAPYCSLCRSWYRTTRTGPLAADRVRRLAEAASLPIEEPFDTAQYRLSHCASGCGPNRLELACRGQKKTKVVEAWLSAAQREQVVLVLDEAVCLDEKRQLDGMN